MNLLSLMPSFWTADPALKTLIGAVQAAMDDYLADVRALLQSGAASTARKPFIDGWESFYGTQPDPSASIDARRSAIMAKMRAGGICTPQKIIDLAASYSGGEIEVGGRCNGREDCCWTGNRDGGDERVGRGEAFLEGAVLLGVAAENDAGAAWQAEAAGDVEKFNEAAFAKALVVEKVLEAASESLFGEFAATGGGGVVDEAELCGEGHLRLAAASGEGEQF